MFDNKTVFSDVIYDPALGYRQERLKVVGYRTDEWNGGLNIPGFIFDDAKYGDWEKWKDYTIGDLVKYKQFYYVPNNDYSKIIKIPAGQMSKYLKGKI